jgi:hypothetical protein
MQSLRVAFCDFYAGMPLVGGFFWNVLSEKYALTLCRRNPDLLFYGPYGTQHKKYKCPKIFWTAELVEPDFSQCDFAFSFSESAENNMQITNMVTYDYFEELLNGSYSEKLAFYRKNQKGKFCNFIYSNEGAEERIEFCRKLQQYEHVDCLGKVLRNVDTFKPRSLIGDNWKDEKLTILKDYQFTIAFENKRREGYITEKIFQPLLVNSIPIYWGAPDVKEYFNPESFISVDDFADYEDCIKHVLKVKNTPELLEQYRSSAPVLSTSKLHRMSAPLIKDTLLTQITILVDFDAINSRSFIYSTFIKLFG